MPKKKPLRNNPKILIIGDSFAADWSVKYNEYKGWPSLLAERYSVVNLAQAGVSEYRIYQQLSTVNLDNFDLVIVSHTSPLRVATRQHPIHNNDSLHYNADLLFSDIEYHCKKFKNLFNSSLKAAYNFFRYHFDVDYFETIYQLLRSKINDILKEKKVIVISILPDLEKFVQEDTVLYFKQDGGTINHMTEQGNQEIYNQLVKTIEKLSTETSEEQQCQ